MQRTITIPLNCFEEYGIKRGDEVIYDRDVEAAPGELAVICHEQSKFFGIYEGRDERGNHILRYLDGERIHIDPRMGWTRVGRVQGIEHKQSGAADNPAAVGI